MRVRSQAGFGVVLMVIIGVIVVLSVFLVSQHFTGRQATSEVASADLSHRANIVADSATEECAHFTMLAGNDSSGSSPQGEELYGLIRKFDASTPNGPTKAGPTDKGFPYLYTVAYDVPQTKAFYADRTRIGDVELGAFAIGALQQSVYPDKPAKGNESFGVMGYEGEVTVRSATGGRDIERVVQYAKNFRVLLLHPPYPFNQFTFFAKRLGPGAVDRFAAYYDAWKTANAPALGDFPIQDMVASPDERPVVTTAAAVPPEAFYLKALDPNGGLNPAALNSADLALYQSQAAAMRGAGFKKLPGDAALEYANGRYYQQLQWENLKNKASHHYESFSRFIYEVAKDGKLELSGVYYVEDAGEVKGLKLAHTFSGRGMLVTSSPEGVRLASCRKAGNDADDRLVIVATEGDITFETGGAPNPVIDADLFAPKGTLKNAAGVTINGVVYVGYWEQGSTLGPRIVRPPDTTAVPWSGGGPLDPDYARKLGVFMTPGYAWKRSWNRRTE